MHVCENMDIFIESLYSKVALINNTLFRILNLSLCSCFLSEVAWMVGIDKMTKMQIGGMYRQILIISSIVSSLTYGQSTYMHAWKHRGNPHGHVENMQHGKLNRTDSNPSSGSKEISWTCAMAKIKKCRM